ncbi:KOW motif-containing protein [Candidatus Saccharibacteria bacterium]|nr:KOW motif-containing protein [Candidatus Saccharibacteria bacterium]
MKSLKVNDKVRVIAGDNKGTEAVIVKIDRANHKAMLEGVEVRERHMKKTQYNPAGGKKTIHVGIDLSNLKLVEPAKVTTKKDTAKKEDKNAKAKKGAK